MTFHLAAPNGMAGFLEHFGQLMPQIWEGLGRPELTPEVREALVSGANEAAGGHSVAELEAERDEMLIDVLVALGGRRPGQPSPAREAS
ncbi:MAG: hypothetical protein R3C39_13445 [Dehalococcoidia bacterium]